MLKRPEAKPAAGTRPTGAPQTAAHPPAGLAQPLAGADQQTSYTALVESPLLRQQLHRLPKAARAYYCMLACVLAGLALHAPGLAGRKSLSAAEPAAGCTSLVDNIPDLWCDSVCAPDPASESCKPVCNCPAAAKASKQQEQQQQQQQQQQQ